MAMRVLITGVSGFVGFRLANHLASQGYEVMGTYLRDRPPLADVELFDVDLLDEGLLTDTLRRAEPEVVIHLAGLSHVGESWSRMADYFRVNVLGSENLVRAAGGTRLLAASSAEVYGAVPEADQPISEDRPLAPQSPYALTKAAMERMVIAADGVVVRSFNIVGPGQARNFALPTFARQLAAMTSGEQEAVLKVGNLTAWRDFVHVDDAVDALELLLRNGETGTCYNLGTGRACSIAESLDRLIEISGVDTEIEEDPARCRPVDLPLLQADNDRLVALGWSQSRDLDRALSDLWQATLALAAGEPGIHVATSV
jgi:GDP-4-dehydro-6-deoxy-D-mannose reductase